MQIVSSLPCRYSSCSVEGGNLIAITIVQQKGLLVGQLEANAPFPLGAYYIYVLVNIKTQRTHALPSLVPPLKAT